MDRMVNYIQLAWKLAYMLRIYSTYNSTVEFSKYEFNNKLLDNATLLRITQSVTLSLSPYIIWNTKLWQSRPEGWSGDKFLRFMSMMKVFWDCAFL